MGGAGPATWWPVSLSYQDEARALLGAFGRADLVKVPRDETVRVLGH